MSRSILAGGVAIVASYVVLARKWRPAQFTDIVGQGPIARTLSNSVRSARIHQAYLLTGSRGIGKTSIARIFAKVIRCERSSERDGWLLSCDDCSNCREIATGTGVDVLEIDGASNNGVDAIREIRENAKFLPATGGRKIYIIDEVHMLTTAAFNALLKTLEEPPAHVVFVFATTEPHKIPPTILSRCQRFDLRRVTAAQIQARLSQVTSAEGIEAELAALVLLARAADGSIRDALSLLDQAIAHSGSKLTAASVRDSVGLIEGQLLTGTLGAVLSRKPVEALALVDRAYEHGHDLRMLNRGLIETLHAVILSKIGAGRSPLLESSEEEWKTIEAMATLRPLEELELIFQALHHGMDWIARSPQPKIALDVLLVKCASAEALLAVEPQREPRANPPPTPAISAPQPARPKPTWEGFIDHVRKTRPLVASILEHSSCGQFPDGEGSQLVAWFSSQEAYYKDQLGAKLYADQLASLSSEYFGRPVRVRVELKEAGETSSETIAMKRDREKRERETAARDSARNHPVIAEARSLLGGELGAIDLLERNPDEGAVE